MSAAPAAETLMPCPFCMSEAVQCCFGLGATYLVECQSCETSGPRAMDRTTAITAWNSRAGAAQRSKEQRVPTRSDIGVIIRDSMGKQEGWLQYLPAADAILNYWAILNKSTEGRSISDLTKNRKSKA